MSKYTDFMSASCSPEVNQKIAELREDYSDSLSETLLDEIISIFIKNVNSVSEEDLDLCFAWANNSCAFWKEEKKFSQEDKMFLNLLQEACNSADNPGVITRIKMRW